MSSVPVALGSVDPEQQCVGEGGRRELLSLESFQGSLGVVTPCRSHLRARDVASLGCNFLAGDHQLSPGSLISALQSSLQCNFVRHWLFSF